MSPLSQEFEGNTSLVTNTLRFLPEANAASNSPTADLDESLWRLMQCLVASHNIMLDMRHVKDSEFYF